MSPRFVVVGDVTSNDTAEVSLAEHDEMVETLDTRAGAIRSTVRHGRSARASAAVAAENVVRKWRTGTDLVTWGWHDRGFNGWAEDTCKKLLQGRYLG
jgi:hypothetical protein